MVFNDYCNKIKTILKRYNYDSSIVDNHLSEIFENYINSTPEKTCIKKLLKNTLNESKQQISNFTKFSTRVITLLETMGYTKKDITPNVKDTIKDAYDNDENEYDCAELCQQDIQKDKQREITHLTQNQIEHIKNSLVFDLHTVNNAAILKLDVSPTAVTLNLKVRLFQDLAYIDTDVKSYIKTIHKYLQGFLQQNSNNSAQVTIKGYAIKFNNLYCTLELKILLLDQSISFSKKALNVIIKSYLNVIETFSEQYQNVI